MLQDIKVNRIGISFRSSSRNFFISSFSNFSENFKICVKLPSDQTCSVQRVITSTENSANNGRVVLNELQKNCQKRLSRGTSEVIAEEFHSYILEWNPGSIPAAAVVNNSQRDPRMKFRNEFSEELRILRGSGYIFESTTT